MTFLDVLVRQNDSLCQKLVFTVLSQVQNFHTLKNAAYSDFGRKKRNQNERLRQTNKKDTHKHFLRIEKT